MQLRPAAPARAGAVEQRAADWAMLHDIDAQVSR
jgi:hypothetical protein